MAVIRSAFLTMLVATTPALAQSGDREHALVRGDVTVERTVGFSWFSPGGSWGDVTNRRVYTTGIRRSRILGATDRLAIAYAAELVPLAVVERTRPNSRTCWFNEAGQYVCRIDRSNRLAAGAGGSPLGMRVYLNDGGRWRAHATGALGAIMFSNHMPIRESALLNFTIEYGGGIEFGTGAGRHLTLGFKLNHFSNAGMGTFNPGLDANVVYLGLTGRRPR
jgi:hypothetical protein